MSGVGGRPEPYPGAVTEYEVEPLPFDLETAKRTAYTQGVEAGKLRRAGKPFDVPDLYDTHSTSWTQRTLGYAFWEGFEVGAGLSTKVG